MKPEENIQFLKKRIKELEKENQVLKNKYDVQKSEKLLKLTQKTSKLGTWRFDLKTQDLVWSEELYTIFQIDPSIIDKTVLYNDFISRFHKDDLPEFYKCIELASNEGKIYTITHRIICPNGEMKWIFSSGIPLRNTEGKINILTGYAQDITEKIKTETELNQFFNLSMDLLCMANLDGYFLKLSHGWKNVLGYNHDELRAQPFITFVHKDDVERTLKELSKLSAGDYVLNFENRYRHKNGSYKILNWNSAPDKKTGLIYCVVRDVTFERRAEFKMKATLHEKETLLKEIHHRVKNNLQLISSLLKLHSEQVKDENFARLVDDSQNRIISMALIHEMLYANSNLSEINLSDYIKLLFHKLQSSYINKNIKLKLNVPKDFCFEIDRMIPIGLIMNEVFTNSFKYAFKNNSGQISVAIEKDSLILSDNGIGIEQAVFKNNKSSFGFQLIELLAEQIDAKKIIKHTKGTSFEFKFKNGMKQKN